MYTVLEYQLSKNLEQVEDLCYITSMTSNILTQWKIKFSYLPVSYAVIAYKKKYLMLLLCQSKQKGKKFSYAVIASEKSHSTVLIFHVQKYLHLLRTI